MLYKILIKSVLFIFLTNCGFSPIYSSIENQRLNIDILNHEGEKQINQEIISKLNIHDNNETELIKLSINTSYEKKDLTKSLTGEIEEYEIEAQTTFTISTKNHEKIFINKEIFLMKNFDDDFEEKNYEKKIKNNIANLNYQKLILQLQKLK